MSDEKEELSRAADCPEPRPLPVSRDSIRLIVLLLLTIGLLVVAGLIALPFLPAITWAVALAILAWPLHQWIARKLARRGLAAAITTAIVGTTIVATGIFATYQVAQESAEIVQQDKTTGDPEQLWSRLESYPLVGRAISLMERAGIDVEGAADNIVRQSLQGASTLAQISLMGFVQFLLAMFILYYVLRDRETFLEGIRDILPLSRDQSNFLMARAADSVHATLYATVVTSVIDSVAFGLTFWATGLPAPVLWSIIMFVLSLLPMLGAGLVWVPASVYLAMQGQWLGLIALITVGVVTATFVDNVLYARLAGDRMRMHNVPVLIAFLGGLAVFGMSGMVLGPAILAVTEAVLELWRRRMNRSGDPRSKTEEREPLRGAPAR